MSSKPYLDFTEYLTLRYPDFKVQKISLNAGCTCPNRDGQKGIGGCTYCNNRSFSPEYTIRPRSITDQLNDGIAFFARKYPTMRYLAYFQSYTNTYGDRDRLLSQYNEALSHPGVVGLVVGTRPDCIDDDLLRYFGTLNRTQMVYIEYGIESTIDRTLESINRGHTYDDSRRAIIATAEHGLPVGAHLIIGLPHEDKTDYSHHIHEINSLPLTSLKLHQLQILRGTQMARDYMSDPNFVHPFTPEEYIEIVSDIIAHLRPDIYVDRFVSQSPADMLLAPRWQLKNHEFTHKLLRYMSDHSITQGSKYIHET